AVDDDLEVVGSFGQSCLDERLGLLWSAHRVEEAGRVAEVAGAHLGGGHDLAGVAAGGGGQGGGAAQVGGVVAVGGAPLPGQVGGQAEHVEFGGHAEGQGLGEVAVEDVGVGVDESRQQGLAGAVDLGVDGGVVGGGDAVAVDEDVGAFGGGCAVEDADAADEGTHESSKQFYIE